MIFLEVAEAVAVTLIFAFFLSQVVAPIWQGRLLLPILRRRARRVEKELRRAREETDIQERERLLQ